METFFERIKSNINEAAISSADLIREAAKLDERIKTLKPIAETLEAAVQQVHDKQVAYDALDAKYNARKAEYDALAKRFEK